VGPHPFTMHQHGCATSEPVPLQRSHFGTHARRHRAKGRVKSEE
jgi:hypothetical protein